jgi:hypothetical protein
MADDAPDWGILILNLSFILAFQTALFYSVYKILQHRHALHVAKVSTRMFCEQREPRV